MTTRPKPAQLATITDVAITGPRTGAALVSTCRPLGYPCLERVDTTDDGGLTWRKGPALGGWMTGLALEEGAVQSLSAIDPLNLLAYASFYESHGAWRSTDGGLSWRPLTLPSSGYDLSAANGDIVEVPRPTRLGNQDIGVFTVIDAKGTVHRRSQFPVGGAFWTAPIVRTASATLVAAGTRTSAWLMKSFDEGLTWTRLAAPAGCAAGYGQLVVADSKTLLLTCVRQGWPTRILRSDDGGADWRKSGSLPPDSGPLAVGSASMLWAIDRTSLEVSTDGGRHWRTSGSPDMVDRNSGQQALATRSTTAWYAGQAEPYTRLILHITDDAGLHWRAVTVPT